MQGPVKTAVARAVEPVVGRNTGKTCAQPNVSWGSTESSGDNRVNSKIPLDLGFCVRQGMPRTGQRTPTGSGKRVPGKPLRRPNGENGSPITRRKRVRYGARSHSFPESRVPPVRRRGHGFRRSLLGTELPVRRPPRARGNRPTATGHPNCSAVACRRRQIEGTGNRVSVTVPEGPRATGSPEVTGPPGNGGRFADQTESVWRPGRACPRGKPSSGADPGNGAAGDRGDRAGISATGRRATGGDRAGKGHCPPPLRERRAMCRSSGRLAPEDRPMVDRPTSGRPREGAPASVGCTARGLSPFPTGHGSAACSALDRDTLPPRCARSSSTPTPPPTTRSPS